MKIKIAVRDKKADGKASSRGVGHPHGAWQGNEMLRHAIGENAMTIAADVSGLSVAWWREPTRDQWLAWVAA
jgi:hypothetical protein